MPSAAISEMKIPYNAGFHYSNYLLFNHGGTRILHGSRDGTILVWDFSPRVLIVIPKHDVSLVGDWARLLNDQTIVSGTSKESYTFCDNIPRISIIGCCAAS